MDIRIQSIHFDASEQLQAFIQKKVSKLEKYYEDIKITKGATAAAGSLG